MAKLFDLNIDERLRLDLLAIHGPGDALVGRQVVGIDLKVRSTRLKDFLLWVELGIGASVKAFDLDNISGLATLWSVKNFDLQQNIYSEVVLKFSKQNGLVKTIVYFMYIHAKGYYTLKVKGQLFSQKDLTCKSNHLLWG